MGHAPAKPGTLDPRTRALIYVALYSSPTLIEPAELRQHVRRAIALGATARDLLDVVQMASGIGLHAFTTGIPLLVDHADE
jgi:alkylhydroperoxidase/carboxymuconolactone decarboxylase family protein YurZ